MAGTRRLGAYMLLRGGRWRLIKNVYHKPSALTHKRAEAGTRRQERTAGEDGGSWYTQDPGGRRIVEESGDWPHTAREDGRYWWEKNCGG